MRKILFYIDTLYRGGAQRVMSNLVTYFSGKYDVVLINDFILDDNVGSYSVPDSVKRIYLREKLSGNPVGKNISRIVALRRAIQKEKPDVVLSFLGGPNERMLLSTVGMTCKKVVSVRNDPNHEYGAGGLSKWIVRRLFTLADGVVFQTDDAANYFQKSIVQKSTVIFNPVAEQFYNVKRSENPQNIVTVGNLREQKNHKMLIDAWKMIEKDFPNEKLIIYGDGQLRDKYERYIAEMQLLDRVELPGVITDVPDKLAEAKLFVLSSNFEGMPNALMEAMAVGIPCISTDCPCGGPRQLIEDGVDGVLVQCEDTINLGLKMKRLLELNEKLDSIGIQGKEKAKSYRSNIIFEKWEAYLAK